jgi:hypothetical protein
MLTAPPGAHARGGGDRANSTVVKRPGVRREQAITIQNLPTHDARAACVRLLFRSFNDHAPFL